MSVWEEIAVGDGPFGVTVIQVVVPGGTSPVYRISGSAPIGGAIVETDRERAIELAAELNRMAGAEAEAYKRGRAHERLDIVDFITSPPGRVPEWVRGQIAELATAIKRGTHDGWGKRLYAKDGAP